MKSKSILTLALLFVLSFSVFHGFVFASHDDNHHHKVTEYINEFNSHSSHDTTCDIHVEYHQSYKIKKKTTIPNIEYISLASLVLKESYNFKTSLELFRPPIA